MLRTRNTEHPHQRGEYHSRSIDVSIDERNTPTSVGNTTMSASSEIHQPGTPPPAWGILIMAGTPRGFNSEHPHQRGEYAVLESSDAMGLPEHPHQRGEYTFLSLDTIVLVRNTPTSVGNTPNTSHNPVDWIRNTPTSVGNTDGVVTATEWANGTPPPAWGIL